MIVRRFWAWPHELRRRGVLGINRRNVMHVLASNPRSLYPRVDDKLLTKQLCLARGIPVPETFAAIYRQADIRHFPELLDGRDDFVIKPAAGSAGRGIIVIAQRNGRSFVSSSGETIAPADLRYHLSTILSGLYSLAGQPDRAIIEQRIVRHTVFENVAIGGTPDVRIVLYRGVPVMAMVRLPTNESRGRANLHQGAVAAAVDLCTGVTYGGVCKSRAISVHPDTQASIRGLKIPYWDKLLEAAVDLADVLELGYLGVDFVLDATVGPVVLEANARPGLAIQVAHRRGLCSRLACVDAERPKTLDRRRRMELVARLAVME
jgi:alpha-L-glutamate ligase-like protein